MITPPKEYTVMGEDGQDYGPVTAGQIHGWIEEGRLGKKTPVMPSDLKDWVFLEMLPEFADAFDPAKRRNLKPDATQPNPKLHKATWLLFIVILIVLGILFLVALKLNPH
jgi:hypothetical protein